MTVPSAEERTPQAPVNAPSAGVLRPNGRTRKLQ